MAKEITISDLVPQKELDDLKKLEAQFGSLTKAYASLALELAKGVTVKPMGLEGLAEKSKEYNDVLKKLQETQNLLSDKQKEYASVIDKIAQKQKELVSLSAKQATEQKKEATTKVELNEQTKISIALTKEEDALIKQVIGTRDANIKRLADEEVALKQISDAKKSLDDQEKKGLITTQEALKKRQSLISSELEHKQAKSELLQILKNEEKINQSVEGTYSKMSMEVERLRKAYRLMTEEEKASAQGVGINQKIQEMDKSLKDTDETMGIHTRKVGDYGIATKSLRAELRNLVEQLAMMKLEGKENTSEYKEMADAAGKMRDAVSDVNQQIGVYASDTAKLDTAKQGINTIVQSYTMWKMASESLGIENKELDELMRTIMGTMALLNAATVVTNALQSQSALIRGIVAVKTWLLTAATSASAAATTAQAVATGTATTAQIALNAAMKASPIGWLLVIIGAVIGAIYGLTKAVKYFIGDSKSLEESLKKQIENTEELGKQNDKYIESLKARGESESKVALENIRLLEYQEKRYKQLNKEAKEGTDIYKETLEKSKESTEKFKDAMNSSADGFRKMIKQAEDNTLEKSMGKVAFATKKANDEYKELTSLLYKLNREGVITAEEMIKAAEAARINMYKNITEAEKEQHDKYLDNKKKELDATRSYEDAKIALIEDDYDRQKKVTEKTYVRNIEDLKNRLENEKELTITARNSINETIKSLEEKKNKDLAKMEVERINSIREANLQNQLAGVKKDSEEYFKIRKDVLESEFDKELKEAEKNGADLSLITLKYEKMKTDIINEQADARNKKIEEAYAVQSIILNQSMQNELSELQKEYVKGIMLKEEYEQKKLEIISKYGIEQAKKAIEIAELQLNNPNLSTESRLALEDQIAKARIELAKAVSDAEISAFEKSYKARRASLELTMDMIAGVGDALNAFSQLGSTLFDRDIQKIDEQSKKAQDEKEKEIENISNLEASGAISKEEAEARKRAAEDKSAQRTKELEAQKAAIKARQAKLDKANSIVQSIINTALGITKTIAELGMPLAIPFVAIAGAVGAAQLATIIAQPIPKYKHGTKDHRGGLAVVGDGGKHEVAITPSGDRFVTPNTPTLIDLPKHSKVLPDLTKIADYRNMRLHSDLRLLQLDANREGRPIMVNVNNENEELKREIRMMRQEFADLSKAQRRAATNAELNYLKRTL